MQCQKTKCQKYKIVHSLRLIIKNDNMLIGPQTGSVGSGADSRGSTGLGILVRKYVRLG